MSTNNGMLSIRNNRSLLRKRNTFSKLKGIIRKENSNDKKEGLTKAENRKIRLKLDEDRLVSDGGRNLAYVVVLILTVPCIFLVYKLAQFFLF